MRATLALTAAFLVCCSQAAAPSDVPAPEAETGAEGVIGAPELVGAWAEYWAPVNGAADTQRYVFLADGRFGWQARGAAGSRSGRYVVEGRTLVLSVERAEGDGVQPGERRVELGECPPNEEARHLDAGYRCVGFDGDAFWRRGEASAEAHPQLFP